MVTKRNGGVEKVTVVRGDIFGLCAIPAHFGAYNARYNRRINGAVGWCWCAEADGEGHTQTVKAEIEIIIMLILFIKAG